ncbi:MAG: RluA family pseudouridine synthase [Clostridia bacterium]|nr:RluA family pseudouridine synthase [Clostridia bacterium]
MRKLTYIIDDRYDRQQLKSFLKNEVGLSSRLVKSLKNSEIGFLKNGEKIRTVDYLFSGDTLEINLDEGENDITPTFNDIDIVFEDEDFIVLNKSPFVAMHPTHNHQGDTLANDVAGYLLNKNKICTFRSIGRLDKGTSGLCIVALNTLSASILSKQKIKKTYYAVAEGIFEGSGVIDAPIYRPDPMKTLRAVGESGDRAVTHWKCICHDDERSFLEINLETGRTHQIRVHFAHLGAALTGDRLYGNEREDITHQALHCGRMEFVHPLTKQNISLFAEMPGDMKKIVKNIQKNCAVLSD